MTTRVLFAHGTHSAFFPKSCRVTKSRTTYVITKKKGTQNRREGRIIKYKKLV